MLFSSKNKIIKLDLERWSALLFKKTPNSTVSLCILFVRLMTLFPEYRIVFYHRFTEWFYKILYLFCRPMHTMMLGCLETGPGLFIQHGYCTMVGAKKIGKNCWLSQQINVGSIDETGIPSIGDNVSIYSGAKVLGNITIGNGAIIGANAVVVKDVPENCTVVGVPAYIIRKNDVKTKEPL